MYNWCNPIFTNTTIDFKVNRIPCEKKFLWNTKTFEYCYYRVPTFTGKPGKNESTPGKPGKIMEFCKKIIKIMEKLHGTWKNIWVDYKSLHARGRPQVLCVCLLSGGWNKCSILCMHWNGPRVNLNCQTCMHITHLQRGKVGSSVWPERSVRGLWGRGKGSPSATLCASIAAGRPPVGGWRRQIDILGP